MTPLIKPNYEQEIARKIKKINNNNDDANNKLLKRK